jgi:hypothetical protein
MLFPDENVNPPPIFFASVDGNYRDFFSVLRFYFLSKFQKD